MKKLLIALFCFVACCSTQAFAQSASGPKFNFKDGDTYDFGTVTEGPVVEHEFTFTNTGNQPLIIQDANPSCSCTTPQWNKQPVLPGKTDKIKVGFKTEGHLGEFYKDVSILSNATNNNNGKRYIIHIKGTVVAKK